MSRAGAELALLRQVWPALTHQPAGDWVLIPDYPLPEGWSGTNTVAIAFQIPAAPGQPPYGIYTDRALTFDGQPPANYTYPAAAGTVPFPGDWALFSWAPEEWAWAENPADGANLVHFATSFADRLAEGV